MRPAIRRLAPYVLRHRRQFLLGLGSVLVTTSVTLLGPWILKYAVDDLSQGMTRQKLGVYALLLLGIALVGGAFRFLMRRLIVGASREIEYELRNDFFAHLQRQPLAYFQTHRTGDLMSRATNDLNAVRMMAGPAIMYTATTCIIFVVAIVLMISIDPWLTAMALIPLPFVSLAVKVFGSAIHRRFEQIQARLADLSVVVQESLSGVRVVRAYGQEDAEARRFERANRAYLDDNHILIVLQSCFYPTMALFMGLGGLMVLWLGAGAVIQGRMTVGEFVAFNGYLVMLTWPMIAFGWVTNLLQRGLASWKRMLEVLEVAPTIDDRHVRSARRLPDLEEFQGAIEFRDLVFAYDGRPVLNHVSVHIAPGDTLAIVGATGSGKSTLISLLPRLYDPPPGAVLIDGIDVREIPLAVLRGLIGFVPQEPFLFSDTVEENIAFGLRPGAEDGEAGSTSARAVQDAAAIARLDKDAAAFPQGYATLVGERGITLSGGQRQRAALARALVADPRILILDDALSAVDTYTEEEILAGLREQLRGRTAILVSHRISTIRDADQIIVLDGGRVVEIGRHDELVAHAGLYAELHRKQLLEEELAAS